MFGRVPCSRSSIPKPPEPLSVAAATAELTLSCSEASVETGSSADVVLLKRLKAEITEACWRMARGVEVRGAARRRVLAGAASARAAALLMKCLLESC